MPRREGDGSVRRRRSWFKRAPHDRVCIHPQRKQSIEFPEGRTFAPMPTYNRSVIPPLCPPLAFKSRSRGMGGTLPALLFVLLAMQGTLLRAQEFGADTLFPDKNASRGGSTYLHPQWTLEAGEASGQPASLPSWTFEIWTGGAGGLYLKTAGTTFWFLGFRVGKILTGYHGKGFLRGNLEYAFDIIPVALAGKGYKTYGGGFDPFAFKWNLVPRHQIAPYFEITGGTLFTRQDVPPGTSNVNFTAQGGPGLRFLLKHNQAVTVGVKFFHLSNAYMVATNPGVNGINVTLGYQWSK